MNTNPFAWRRVGTFYCFLQPGIPRSWLTLRQSVRGVDVRNLDSVFALLTEWNVIRDRRESLFGTQSLEEEPVGRMEAARRIRWYGVCKDKLGNDE